MLGDIPVIDADGHVNDWHLDWKALAAPGDSDFVPESVRDENGFPHLRVEGRLLPGGKRPKLDYRDIEAAMARFTRDGKYWLPRPGEEDPTLRLPDMDEMGIDTAVLFGGHCLLVASVVESPDVARVTLRAYNDHLAGYCAADPQRLKGVAMIPMQAPEVAADELRRAVRELGFVAGVLPPHHADGTLLDDRRLDPIWAAAVELDVPICIHLLGMAICPYREWLGQHRLREAYNNMPSQLALGSLILGGVLDRFPDLTVAILEAGAGWLPSVVERMQSSYENFTLRGEELEREPEETVRSGQIYVATEPDEKLLPAVVDLVGADRIVLGSDYCHPEGMCPFTMKVLYERSDLGADVKRSILHENPACLYRL